MKKKRLEYKWQRETRLKCVGYNIGRGKLPQASFNTVQQFFPADTGWSRQFQTTFLVVNPSTLLEIWQGCNTTNNLYYVLIFPSLLKKEIKCVEHKVHFIWFVRMTSSWLRNASPINRHTSTGNCRHTEEGNSHCCFSLVHISDIPRTFLLTIWSSRMGQVATEKNLPFYLVQVGGGVLFFGFLKRKWR